MHNIIINTYIVYYIYLLIDLRIEGIRATHKRVSGLPCVIFLSRYTQHVFAFKFYQYFVLFTGIFIRTYTIKTTQYNIYVLLLLLYKKLYNPSSILVTRVIYGIAVLTTEMRVRCAGI